MTNMLNKKKLQKTRIKTMITVIDPIDKIDNKRYRKLYRKECSKETGITTIKARWIIIDQTIFNY